LNKNFDMVTIAKSVLNGRRQGFTSRDFYRELLKRAAEAQTDNQSPEQAFAKYTETQDGKLLMAAMRKAEQVPWDEPDDDEEDAVDDTDNGDDDDNGATAGFRQPARQRRTPAADCRRRNQAWRGPSRTNYAAAPRSKSAVARSVLTSNTAVPA
jgi:hypothetical protein